MLTATGGKSRTGAHSGSYIQIKVQSSKSTIKLSHTNRTSLTIQPHPILPNPHLCTKSIQSQPSAITLQFSSVRGPVSALHRTAVRLALIRGCIGQAGLAFGALVLVLCSTLGIAPWHFTLSRGPVAVLRGTGVWLALGRCCVGQNGACAWCAWSCFVVYTGTSPVPFFFWVFTVLSRCCIGRRCVLFCYIEQIRLVVCCFIPGHRPVPFIFPLCGLSRCCIRDFQSPTTVEDVYRMFLGHNTFAK